MLRTIRKISKKISVVFLTIMLVLNSSSFSYASEQSNKPADTGTEIAERMNESEEAPGSEAEKQISFSGGKGTAKEPYLISSKKDLLALAGELSKQYTHYIAFHYKLTKDISLGSTEWVPMCQEFAGFCGVFDGNGHKITIKKMASGSYMGFFSKIDPEGIVKNLTIVSSINKKLSIKKELYFGLIAGFSGGTITNCSTEGTVTLTISNTQNIAIGGIVGRTDNIVRNVQNDAAFNISKTGNGFISCGGIVGSSTGAQTQLEKLTNNGNFSVKSEATARVGGIIAEFFDGKKLSGAVNNGDLSLYISKGDSKKIISIGGIVSEASNIVIDRAINQKKIYLELTSKPDEEEIVAGGIAGVSRNSKFTNVANEGSIECISGRVGIAAGIVAGSDKSTSISNAYNSGAIYAHTEYNNDSKNKKYYDLYAHGLIGGNPADVKNFYNNGKITMKYGNKAVVNGEALANIRRGESTKSFTYCYWSSDIEPFPPLQKATDTSSAFNATSGKLAKSITIGSKKYSNITDALNAWIDNQKDKKNYVKWSGKGGPKFTEKFGYTAPKQ